MLGSITPATAASGSAILPVPLTVTTLDNGLRVIVAPCDFPGVVAVATVFLAGSRDEIEPGTSGFAHFVEHLMLRGTTRFPKAERERILTLLGAETNARTQEDCTIFHVEGSATALDTILDIEADRVRNASLSEEVLRTEAKVILGEFLKDATAPETALEEKLLGTAFSTHPYRHPVMGLQTDIRAMPDRIEAVRRFVDRGYGPGNCILVVVGDVAQRRSLPLCHAPQHAAGDGTGHCQARGHRR